MTSVLLFEFDKIFNKIIKQPPGNMRDICFPTSPDIVFKEEALQMIIEARTMQIPVILLAFEKERYLKEALFSCGACAYFDQFIFLDELSHDHLPFEDIILEELYKAYGLCKPYIYHPFAAEIVGPLQVLLRQAAEKFISGKRNQS